MYSTPLSGVIFRRSSNKGLGQPWELANINRPFISLGDVTLLADWRQCTPLRIDLMILAEFEMVLASVDGLSENDRTWFSKGLRRYALAFPKGLTDELTVNRDTTLRFSRDLSTAGAPAWQRWQIVNAH